LPFVLRKDCPAKPACQCQHAGECCFRNRSAVDIAHIGDDHVLAQGRLINEIVDAGAKRLDPFQSRRGSQDFAR
jgi:hypothetical protein